MHVGWSGVFTVPEGQPRPTITALRDRVSRRLDDLEWVPVAAAERAAGPV